MSVLKSSDWRKPLLRLFAMTGVAAASIKLEMQKSRRQVGTLDLDIAGSHPTL
ncbi:hypothetical protein [Nostoc sp. PA-18-2419]|uniref:hypothetical protein n=1 Tax=Nostoc sp. PA-18-2419 TaxID=2575443 RepID=UPI001671B5F6|nr:hypothetical protein [Nostoc sp. PA-18-2419]